eukprot:Gb_33936 [translate_table: standard]
MGNALECVVSGMAVICGNDEVRREIKVMKLDGHILRFNGSICVKEVLLDYPNHAVVPYDKGCCPTVGGPLSPHTKLEGGHLYFSYLSTLFHIISVLLLLACNSCGMIEDVAAAGIHVTVPCKSFHVILLRQEQSRGLE